MKKNSIITFYANRVRRRDKSSSFVLLTYPSPPPPSLLLSLELNTPFPFRNEKVETVVVDDAPPILLKFIHLAMRIIINRKLLKEKKSLKPFRKEGKGGGVLFHMTLVSAILKWQYQMAIKVSLSIKSF